ncbi:AMP-binding protein [Mangrovivirga sp. M17]|uniref:AMP-binding protein n=1 Tax=Mangrovivirga halotolerans TaxID=2993936 RepID=A0ABT3RWU8_9BACT|nr:AMP-binding protein [Mangrovivirga halotolerans]MCX2745687.1 AMP-binding protein [Mangrovivirga halotolerans]
MERRNTSLKINGRVIGFDEIINPQNDLAKTEFEKSVFDTISSFLKGDNEIIQQTSGSTGKPKQIKISRGRLIASAKMTGEFLEYDKKERESLLCIPASFIGGKMVLIRALVFDLPIKAEEPSGNPFKGIEKVGITSVTPYQIKNIIEEEDTGCINADSIILIGGGVVNEELEKKLANLPGEIYHTYAMTETVSNIALRKLNQPHREELFETLPGINIRSEQGRLLVRGNVTSDKWLDTNDIVEIIEKNKFKWLGRADNVINSGGIKINLDDLKIKIEKALNENGAYDEIALLKVKDDKFGEGYVVFIEENSKLESKLILDKNIKIDNKVKPKKIITINKIPKTKTDKIDYKSLRKIFNDLDFSG